MPEFINTIDALGDDAVIDSIIDRSITEFKDDVITTIGYGAFYKCTALAILDLPNLASIEPAAFNSCSALTALILRNEDEVVTLSNTSAFTGSLIASGTGYIYVPAALVGSYKAATNWSTYADQFRALEDYTVDGTITGELDESKI